MASALNESNKQQTTPCEIENLFFSLNRQLTTSEDSVLKLPNKTKNNLIANATADH